MIHVFFSLRENINRSRPKTQRPKEWTDHGYALQNSNEPSKIESSEKKNLWQKLKSLLGAKRQVQQPTERTPVVDERPNPDPSNNWDTILSYQTRRTSTNHPQPMSDVATPTRKARDENSIPKSQSQWQRAFKKISENKKAETKRSPILAVGDTGSDNITHGTRPILSGSRMEFWGAEGFRFSPPPVISEPSTEDVWTMSS